MAETYHRVISHHNRNEFELARASMELWGYEAHVAYGGICVQALPGAHTGKNDYSFGTDVEPIRKKGYIGRQEVLRELVWPIGWPGVEERDNGNAACIRLTWVRK